MTSPLSHRLPRAYAGFADLFAQFEPPLAHTLGGLLASFASRLDLPQAFDDQPQGEFTGFDGLINAGDLAQLLESDWLLHELDPDDFVRRVAEREVIYRRRAFVDSGRRGLLAVVLDCGPWMLGRNRLCALAALFHLAAVAEKRNADLRWAVAGDPWQEGLTRDTLRRYLGRIVQDRLDAKTVTRRIEALEADGPLDLWYVGASETADVGPDVGAGSTILLKSLPDIAGQGARAQVVVRSARRQTTLDVTFPDDETCVAALRRPFRVAAMARRAPSPASRSVLSALPYDSTWMLDRFNQTVLIRLPEGLLWQSVLSADAPGLWVPLREGTLLLGAAISPSARLSLMLATPRGAYGSQPELYDITLMTFNRSGTDAPTSESFGWAQMARKQFPEHGIPPLELSPGQSPAIVQKNGKRLLLNPVARETGQNPIGAGRVMFCTANYRVDRTRDGATRLQVTSLSRDSVLLRCEINSRISSLVGKPRHVLFAPSSRTAAVSSDGHVYEVFSPEKEDIIELPEGAQLLQVEASLRGMIWEPGSGTLRKAALSASDRRGETLAHIETDGLGPPRHCPLTGTVFVLQTDEDGQPVQLIPLLAKRDWRHAVPIDLAASIEKARTQWPAT